MSQLDQIVDEAAQLPLAERLDLVKRLVGGVQESASEPDLRDFYDWLAVELKQAQWDRQIAEDSAAGRLDFLVEEALAEYSAGLAAELRTDEAFRAAIAQKARKKTKTVEDVAGCAGYVGPAKTVEEMDEAVREMFRREWSV